MNLPRRSCVLIVVAVCLLGSCSSDSSPSKSTSTAGASAAGADATDGSTAASTPADGGAAEGGTSSGSTDCAALTDALGRILVNWQVVLGLVNSATTEWASTPIGTVSEFGAQLATAAAALDDDSAAADALSFMSGANDIVVRGVGGDATAQADLATYLGSDVTANIYKQQDISLAYAHSACA